MAAVRPIQSDDRGESPSTAASARQGALAGGLTQVAQQILSVAATIVLARLLTQADIGIVAAANSILALSAVLLSMGFGVSVVHIPNLTRDWLATMFWAAFGASSLVAVAFCISSPFLASLFGIPAAAPYLAALAPTVALSLTASIPLALLRRRFAFRAYWAVHLIAMVVYVVVQVSLAVAGWGAWAIIVGQLAMASVHLLGALVAARYVPALAFSWFVLAKELNFAGGMLGNSLATYGIKSADYWVIGNVLGASALGGYYLAYVLPTILTQRLSKVVETMLLPMFAREQGNLHAVRKLYVSSGRLLAGLGFPAMVGVALLAQPIVNVFFGDAWSTSAGPLRWIALACVFAFVGDIPSQVSMANKRIRPVLVSHGIRLTVFVPTVVTCALVWRTTEAVAVGVLISASVWFATQQLLVAAPLGLPVRLLGRDWLAIAISTACMSVAVLTVDSALSSASDPSRLVAGVLVGVAAYIFVGMTALRATFGPLMHDVGTLLRRRTRKGTPDGGAR